MENKHFYNLVVTVMIVIVFLLSLSAPLIAADSYFEKGKKYHIHIMALGCDVLILSEPDKLGWIKIKLMDEKAKKELGFEEGLINLKTCLAANEIK